MQEPRPGGENGKLLAAVRLGEAASIGAGCWVGLAALAQMHFSLHQSVSRQGYLRKGW